jgi:hypothetical protein
VKAGAKQPVLVLITSRRTTAEAHYLEMTARSHDAGRRRLREGDSLRDNGEAVRMYDVRCVIPRRIRATVAQMHVGRRKGDKN